MDQPAIRAVIAGLKAFTGDSGQDLPSLTGFIYLPAAALIAVTSVIAARLGATLSMRLPVPLLKRLFSLLLIIVALKILL